jgi:hypothetical protein
MNQSISQSITPSISPQLAALASGRHVVRRGAVIIPATRVTGLSSASADAPLEYPVAALTRDALDVGSAALTSHQASDPHNPVSY